MVPDISTVEPGDVFGYVFGMPGPDITWLVVREVSENNLAWVCDDFTFDIQGIDVYPENHAGYHPDKNFIGKWFLVDDSQLDNKSISFGTPTRQGSFTLRELLEEYKKNNGIPNK